MCHSSHNDDLNEDTVELLRSLPSVDAVLRHPQIDSLEKTYGRELLVHAVRYTLNRSREEISQGHQASIEMTEIIGAAGLWLEQMISPSLIPVINATGVIVHTNLGRAPLATEAIEAVAKVTAGYSNLEYDLEEGNRGTRRSHAEELVRMITTAESALVVNNNAAAVLLMLTALCKGREVVISRGQLVEIGGGFRVPDVMAESGATLKEVGTTNRTHLADYEKAINDQTAALLVAHHSNFKMIGFTSEPPLQELADLAHQYGLPLLYDQGSGAIMDTSQFGLDKEPTIQTALATGVDLVTFSGDKLLAGPQAGIVVGSKKYVDMIAKHPLARAVRADKMCLAALTSTLSIYLKNNALDEIPVWQMISYSITEIEERAKAWVAVIRGHIGKVTIIDGYSTIGGGSLPGAMLATKLVAIDVDRIDEFSKRLRQSNPPIITRIANERLLLDPRTVRLEQDPSLLRAVNKCLDEMENRVET